MAARSEGVSVARLRQALATRVEAEGLRPVARDVGLDPKSVIQIIEGAAPRASTRQKLLRWYVRQMAVGHGTTETSSARAALEVLLQDFPPALRTGALSQAVAAFRRIYEGAELPSPDWVRVLEAEGSE